VFDLVELWVENVLMLEVLTADLQADYLRTMTIPTGRPSLRGRRRWANPL
jgi:hypothetical protein